MFRWRLGTQDHLWLCILGMAALLDTPYVRRRLGLAGKVDSELAKGALLAWQASVSGWVCHWRRWLYLASMSSLCVVLNGCR